MDGVCGLLKGLQGGIPIEQRWPMKDNNFPTPHTSSHEHLSKYQLVSSGFNNSFLQT